MRKTENLISRQAQINYDLFHAKPEHYGLECHHVWGRIGYLICCKHFLIPAEHEHQLDHEFVKKWRDLMIVDKLIADKYWNKYSGCTSEEPIFIECEKCLLWRGNETKKV